VEQGLNQIAQIMSHTYNNTSTGKMIYISLQTMQMEAGTSSLLLTNPTPHLNYLTPCWLLSVRSFLRQHQIQLEFTTNWNFRHARVNDQFIMDSFRNSHFFSQSEMKHLNAARIFIQVATLSDITTADGLFIHPDALSGSRFNHRTTTYSWIRQPMITTTQRQLWKKALKKVFTSSSQSSSTSPTKLTCPLGDWIANPNQIWSHYYNFATDELWEWKPRGRTTAFSRDESKSKLRQQAFHRSHILFSLNIISPSVVPAEVTLHPTCTATVFAKFSGTRRQPLPLPPLTFTQTSYINHLPRYRRRFLSWCRKHPLILPEEAITLLTAHAATGRDIEIGSDGGLNVNGGTFGFVLSIPDCALWDGAGPVDGAPHCSSSTRSELFGYASTLELLLLLCNVHNFRPQTCNIVTWVDSTSALQILSNLHSPKKASRQFPDEADILSHIKWLWSQLPSYSHTLKWVKAHQDNDSPFSDLPWKAKLNVMANSLATAFYTKETSSLRRPQQTHCSSHPLAALCV
jgi:hypothetical protein